MDLVVRAIFVFFLMLVITRAVGRRELSSMEPFDLILLVVMGDLIQQGVTQSDYSLTGSTIVIVTIAVLTVGTAYLSYRFRRLRPLLEASRRARRRRPADREQPAAPAHDRRGAAGRGAAAVDRSARRGRVRRARDQRARLVPQR
jgi:hypothetical protein